MAHTFTTDTPDPRADLHGHGLIYGLDPLRVDHAKIIAANPEDHPAMRRALAFATLKTARGETVDRKRMIAAVMAASGLSVVDRIEVSA
ncbi:hypothetical protein CEW89_08540 [Celeribacter ethanolicus]|uniref:Uncharacterized protein n=1 Tax=Celeribacter ethanolicus TaxID=1758178 RepID=A0A291GBT3_9RHOB|nr:hypothetical protein [Celeribacter ethanolicus]ATG47617.1 hypothetical protein CEW89_08540 [Celeribacter ethanolicus]